MAVTFDSRFEKGFSASSTPVSFVSNAGTVTGTVGANANRVLIAVVGCSRSLASIGTITVTWNGVAMTAIASLGLTANDYSIHIFGLIAPATGNQTLSASWVSGGTADMIVGAVSVYNADQSTGWQNGGTDAGTGLSASSTVTTASGNMAVVGHVNNNASSTTATLGTSAWIETAFAGNYAQSYLASIASTAVISWTLGASVNWTHVKVDVIQASAAVTITPGAGSVPFTGLTPLLGFGINMPDVP